VAGLRAGPADARIDMVAAGSFHSAAITFACELFNWGSASRFAVDDSNHAVALFTIKQGPVLPVIQVSAATKIKLKAACPCGY